ncbi:uncharacterized protein PgNI_04165 [Pyricularia grisea]|uniref:Uncharacterized protein n=1 Tax=Pyricularia grisea TaxID=148305 RepID=A0A6P8BAS4_PYRGI|nr:uncharacterized protein PgNI_04165 [Pyricularia grisea]TLD12931.1 hypothetical protein PgNI_04165 [Pyricularia grisea]
MKKLYPNTTSRLKGSQKCPDRRVFVLVDACLRLMLTTLNTRHDHNHHYQTAKRQQLSIFLSSWSPTTHLHLT